MNRQPTLASYLRRPDEDRHRAFAIDVLTLRDGLIADIVAFSADACRGLGLPEILPPRG